MVKPPATELPPLLFRGAPPEKAISSAALISLSGGGLG